MSVDRPRRLGVYAAERLVAYHVEVKQGEIAPEDVLSVTDINRSDDFLMRAALPKLAPSLFRRPGI